MSRYFYACLVTASALTLMIMGFAIGSELWASMRPDLGPMPLDELIIDS